MMQEELLDLRRRHPLLVLRKSAGLPTSPFPLLVTAVVVAPAAAAHCDAQSLTVQLTLKPACVSGAAPDGRGGSATDRAAAVTVTVLNPELPQPLREAIAADLHAAWAERLRGEICVCCGSLWATCIDAELAGTAPGGGGAGGADGGALQMLSILAQAHTDFLRLISLRPEFLERYEGVDSEGRTVRRVAVLSDVATVEIDVGPPQAAAAAAAAAKKPARAPTALPTALEQEVAAIAKRHAGTHVDRAPLPPPPPPAAAVAGLAGSLAQLALDADAPDFTPAVVLTVPLRPTDPDWSAADGALPLVCTVGGRYPAPGSFAVAVGPGCQLLSELERSVMDRLLQAQTQAEAGRPGGLRAVLRNCENGAAAILHQACDIALEITRRRAAQRAPGDAAAARQPGHNRDGSSGASQSGSPSDDGSSFSGDRSWSESDDEERAAAAAAAASGFAAAAGQGALRLTLEGLELEGIDALEPLTLVLQRACARCRAPGEASFSVGAAAAGGRQGGVRQEGACAACHAPWALTLAPRLVHERSNVLAAVTPEGCAPVDLLPSLLAAQCGECSAQAAFRGWQVGRWAERACGRCHRRLAFKADAALFAPAPTRPTAAAGAAPAAGPAGAPGRAAAAAADWARPLVPGQPLPDRGACVHYRHSYRWLRFPCCGRRYPCDLCHELGVEDGHAMRWAQRMCCGFCSVEQPVADRCAHCCRKVAGSASNPSGRATRFWEGGQGQRDPRRLSRRDAHRYRGSAAKTRSNKAARVGRKMRDRSP
jgi:hypothetical protein